MGRNFGEKKKKRGKSIRKKSDPKVSDPGSRGLRHPYTVEPTVQQDPDSSLPFEEVSVHVPPKDDDEESSEEYNSTAHDIKQLNYQERLERLQRVPPENIMDLLDEYQSMYKSLQTYELDEFASNFRRDFMCMLSHDKKVAMITLAQTARDILTDPAKADLRGSMAYLIHSLFRP